MWRDRSFASRVRSCEACAVKQGTSQRATFATVITIHPQLRPRGLSASLNALTTVDLPHALCPESRSFAEGSVFWLPDQPSLHAFPAPKGQWLRTKSIVQLVPGYSDGLASELHRLPAGPQSFDVDASPIKTIGSALTRLTPSQSSVRVSPDSRP